MESQDLSDIARALPDALVVIDEEGRLQWANAAAEHLLGTRAANFLGESTFGFVYPEDADLVAVSLASVRNKNVGTPIEVRVRSADGWRLVEIVGANLLANPKVRGIVLSIRDLTDRRRWEVARNEVSRFRAIVHNAGTIIMSVDATGRVEAVSAAIMRLLGHPQGEVEGQLLEELVAEGDRARLRNVLSSAVHTAAGVSRPLTVEVHFVRRGTGEEVPFELSIVNLLDDPTVRGLVVSGQDVRQLRESLDRLAIAQTELIRRERLAAVGELASMIGHELRNPLTAVTNAHFLVRQDLGESVDPDVDAHLAMAERETARAVDLAANLVDYVRPRKFEPGPIEVSEVIDEVLQATPPPPQVRLDVAAERSTMTADRAQFTEMLANLLTNAYEAVQEGGMVRVATHVEGDEAVITVEDGGSGVDPEVSQRLFEPFFTTKSYGSGLGLAIVKRLVKNHRGIVTLQNRPGGGAVATLRLPFDAGQRSGRPGTVPPRA